MMGLGSTVKNYGGHLNMTPPSTGNEGEAAASVQVFGIHALRYQIHNARNSFRAGVIADPS